MQEEKVALVPAEVYEEDAVPEVEGAFGLSVPWNAALTMREERERKPRDYVWASELGKPMVDIWLNLRATPVTNPPNARSLRKFEAGNIFEWIVRLVLLRAGIMVEAQERLEYQYTGSIKVSGKPDFEVGGKPDYERGRAEIEALPLPETFTRTGLALIAYLQEKYPNGLEQGIIEVKSCSVFMFEKYMKAKKAAPQHRKQLMHYLVSKGYRKGLIIYLCRDDLRMLELPVLNPGPDLDEYIAEVTKITAAMRSEVQPDKEPLIIFDELAGKFAKHWGVEYSSYLTMLYGFERPDLYVEHVKPLVGRWNRVMGRIKKGDKMTPKNLEAIEEMRGWGFNPEALAEKFAPEVEGEEAE